MSPNIIQNVWHMTCTYSITNSRKIDVHHIIRNLPGLLLPVSGFLAPRDACIMCMCRRPATRLLSHRTRGNYTRIQDPGSRAWVSWKLIEQALYKRIAVYVCMCVCVCSVSYAPRTPVWAPCGLPFWGRQPGNCFIRISLLGSQSLLCNSAAQPSRHFARWNSLACISLSPTENPA